VRLAFLALTLVVGAGAVLYLWLWLTVPAGDPVAAAVEGRPAAAGRLARAPRERASSLPLTDIALGLLLLLVAGLLVAWRAGADLAVAWVLPALVLLAGAGLAWSQLDAVEREALSAPSGRTPVAVLRIGGGVLLATIGVLLIVAQGQDPGDLLRAAVAGLAVLAGIALVLAPVWLRLVRDLGRERSARAREAERADIAAHLHDSVLQTLALIRARAGDADAVARLARAQERELRAWLYADRPSAGDSVVAAVRDVAAEVEDRYGVPVDVVTVGETRPGRGCEPLLAATREALTNAVLHGRAPVSLYAEIGPDRVEVFVRDRGDGFDPAEVAADRYGVRESILGRMRRHGGEADIRSGPDRGTEVHLVAPATMLAGVVPDQATPVEARPGTARRGKE
jgi:signal transduction histidine kinase